MFRVDELDDGMRQCRFPLTAGPPHFFCGEAVETPPYCDYCRRAHKPFTGKVPKDWQALAGMMDAVETTVLHHTPRDEGDPASLDGVLREADTHFDEPGGLMGRT